MDEDRFRYVEQDPPLTGEERKRDYHRQYGRWKYATDAEYREKVKATQTWHYHNNPVYQVTLKLRAKLRHQERTASGESAEYQRKRAAEKRARMLAVLAIAVGLLLPVAVSAQETERDPPVVPRCFVEETPLKVVRDRLEKARRITISRPENREEWVAILTDQSGDYCVFARGDDE